MGIGYRFTCGDCGEEYEVFLGCGFRFPVEYGELMEDIEAGRYGEEWQELAAQTEHYAIDAEEHLFRCEKCGHWECGPSLSIYAPKDEEAVLEQGYVMADELKTGYTLLRERVHVCSRCGHDMRMLSDRGAAHAALKCPGCGGRLERNPYAMFWD